MTFNPQQHLIDLRGKQYLEVAWRLVWFRDAHPNGSIITTMLSTEPLVMRCEVVVDNVVIATGHGSADAQGRKVVWSGREIEKAETASIGRALAAAGFGTQFSGEYDDAADDHLADSPRPPQNRQQRPPMPRARKRDDEMLGPGNPLNPERAKEILEFSEQPQEMHVVVHSLRIESDGKRPYLLAETVDGAGIRIDTRQPFEQAGYDVSTWTQPGTTVALDTAADIMYHQFADGSTQFVAVEPFDFD